MIIVMTFQYFSRKSFPSLHSCHPSPSPHRLRRVAPSTPPTPRHATPAPRSRNHRCPVLPRRPRGLRWWWHVWSCHHGPLKFWKHQNGVVALFVFMFVMILIVDARNTPTTSQSILKGPTAYKKQLEQVGAQCSTSKKVRSAAAHRPEEGHDFGARSQLTPHGTRCKNVHLALERKRSMSWTIDWWYWCLLWWLKFSINNSKLCTL